MTKLPSKTSIYEKTFTLVPKELGIKAYYNIQYYKYSEPLKRHKYIFHIFMVEPFKLSKVRKLLDIEEFAIKKFFNESDDENKNNSVFHAILEVQKYKRFIPDISIYRMLHDHKHDIEKSLPVVIGQTVCILYPNVKDDITIIPPLASQLKENHDYGFVRSYEEALELIDNFNHITPDYIT